jgi:predicted nucleic acid-binding protein
MAIILDTNALSAFVDGEEKLLLALKTETEIAIPTVVLGEYLYGIQQSRLRVSYQAWIKKHLPLFELLPVIRETAERYSDIRRELKAAGTPIPTNDLWIAAIARHHHMPLVTRDAHFRAIRGLEVLAW